jgi:hypothetical protein
MGTRKHAQSEIINFLKSDIDRILLLTGTYQNEKHRLVLDTLSRHYTSSTELLLRVNNSNLINDFLSGLDMPNPPRLRKPAKWHSCRVSVDTMNPASWRGSPRTIDIAVVYPIDSLNDKTGPRCIDEMLSRGPRKLLLVSWTDNKDFGWVSVYNPARVVFDAAEERPDYHQRMLELLMASQDSEPDQSDASSPAGDFSMLPSETRCLSPRHHIDPGFVHHRLIFSTFGAGLLRQFRSQAHPSNEYPHDVDNDNLLVSMVLDLCRQTGVPTLGEALQTPQANVIFCSTERLAAGGNTLNNDRAQNRIETIAGKNVILRYSTEHIHSTTSRVDLSEGCTYSIVGAIHRIDPSEIEVRPLIMGPPSYEHPANGKLGGDLLWYGWNWYELFVHDIEQFSRAKDVQCTNDEWMPIMQQIGETMVKDAICEILGEESRKDWGGEQADHFSSDVTIRGRRTTAAFLLKGPAAFRPMTPRLLGKQGDQIYRLAATPAEVLIVQHCHEIRESVRATLRAFAVAPHRPRFYCLIDGRDTYRLLKAYGKI